MEAKWISERLYQQLDCLFQSSGLRVRWRLFYAASANDSLMTKVIFFVSRSPSPVLPYPAPPSSDHHIYTSYLAEIVCVAFGLFFVFSVKQAPDRKMRNFKKSVQKPVVVIGRRLSIASSKTSRSTQQVCKCV